MFSKFSSVYLRNAFCLQAPIMYAAINTNFDSPLSYFDFMIRSTLLSVLLFPVQIGAMQDYCKVVGYKTTT